MLSAAQRIPSRARRSVIALSALVLTAGGAGASATSSAAATPTPPPRAGTVTLDPSATVISARELLDGTVEVVTNEGNGGSSAIDGGPTRFAHRRHHLGDAGEIGAPVQLPAAAGGWLLPSGGTFGAFTRGGTSRTPFAAVGRDVAADGAVTAEQPISIGGNHGGWASVLGIGPTGAIALETVARRGRHIDRALQTIALRFRPAGATRFGRAVRLDRTRLGFHPNRDPDLDGSEVQFSVAFAPDGGAALIALPDSRYGPAPTLRWISPSGVIGVPIDLGIRWRGSVRGKLAFGPTGKLTLVLGALRDTVPRASARGHIIAGTLAEGATTPPTWQRLSAAADSTVSRNLISLTTGPGEHVAALVSTNAEHLQLYESDGAGFRHTAELPSIFPTDASVFAAADGTLTAVWHDEASDSFADEGVYIAARPAGATAFSTPRRVTPSVVDTDRFPALELAQPLSGGRLLIAYREYEGNDGLLYLTIVRA